jgi:hypothetical protein
MLNALAALDRPYPAAVPAAGGEHLGTTGPFGAAPARQQDTGSFVNDLDRGRTPVRVHPDDPGPDASAHLR